MTGRPGSREDLTRLAALDPAGPADPRSALSAPAQAMLDRVLATPAEGPEGARGAPAPRRRGWRRPILVTAALAVGASAAVLLPGLGDRTAEATWTAQPGALDGVETQAAAQECREVWAQPGDGERPQPDELAAMRPLIAEHRGDVDLVVIGDGRWTATCLLDAAGHIAGLAPPDTARPQPTGGDVEWWFGGMSKVDAEHYLHAVVGRAGPDVVAVSLHPRRPHEGAEVVHATVKDGWFIAFWPELKNADPFRTPATVTLRSGEVLREVVVPFG